MNNGEFRESDGAKFYRLIYDRGQRQQVKCYKTKSLRPVSIQLECRGGYTGKPCPFFAGYDDGV